jgi:DNA-binding NarL/FixJ family response regulator
VAAKSSRLNASLKDAKMSTRILICCDEPILTGTIERALRQARKFELAPSCLAVSGLIKQLERHAPDLLLLDLTPEVTCALLSELNRRMPDLKTVLWANAVSMETALQAVALGVRGILRKSLPTELQVSCLDRVRAGERWFEKALTDGVPAACRPDLAPHEIRVLDLLIQGLNNREIAHAMSTDEGTVKTNLSQLFHKVGVKDRFELALFALKYRSAWQSAAAPAGRDDTRARFSVTVPASL